MARKALRNFWEQPRYADSEKPLEAWHQEVKKAEWGSPADIKAKYCKASILKENRVVFNIVGNKYRLVGKIKLNAFKAAKKNSLYSLYRHPQTI